MAKRYSQQFKDDAVQYRKDHPEMTLNDTANHLGISVSALKHWLSSANKNDGIVDSRGSGNYSSDEAKENARLKRQLRDAEDALEVLKKAIGILGKWPLLFIPQLVIIPARCGVTIRNAGFRSAGYCIILAFPRQGIMPGYSISLQPLKCIETR